MGQSSLFFNDIFLLLLILILFIVFFFAFFSFFFTLTPVVYQFVGKMGVGWFVVSLLLGLRKQATPKSNCIISGVNL